eukprot:Tbor_TRINITY_DN6111_c0_g2::TRINITY_DN6111_c0_g2_i1::g.21528::m.21528
MRSIISPKTARAARLYRQARIVSKSHTPQTSEARIVPSSDGEIMVWVNSHIQRDADMRLSKEEEALRESKMPVSIGNNNMVATGQINQGSMFHFREYPMFPGEYVPAGHNSLSSIRGDLRLDLAAQSVKDAWVRVSGGRYFKSTADYYSRVEGVNESQIGEIVSAVIPGFNRHESSELVTRILEIISKPDSTPARQLGRTITAEALGLDNSPGHYSNFLEWMGRITETKAFKTEHALFQFTRRAFNRNDVRVMNENYSLMSRATLDKESSDGYSHFYSILKDFAVKAAREDTRHQIGVRIDGHELDEETGIAVGSGFHLDRKVTAFIRENRDKTGKMNFMGKPIHVAFDGRSWVMEQLLWVFDEAGLDYRDFDVYIKNEGPTSPFMGDLNTGMASRLAIANALVRLIPLVRPPLKKAGLLSADSRLLPGHSYKFADGFKHRRRFSKR